MVEQYICTFCNKEYKTLSSLNHHQKTAKFCIELQKKEETNLKHIELFNCEYCSKEFTAKYNYNIHVISCKEKKLQDTNYMINRIKELETQNEKIKKEKEIEVEKIKKEKEIEIEKIKKEKDKYERETSELKVKLKYEQTNNTKLEKANKQLNRIIEKRPVTNNNVYQDNSTKSSNYTIQFNQYFNNISVMDKTNIDCSVNSLPRDIINNYNYLDIKNEVNNTLSDNMVQFMFSTDENKKMVVVKKEDNTVEKIDINDFLVKYYTLGQDSINKFLDDVKIAVDEKVNNDIMDEETFYRFKIPYTEMKRFINTVPITDINSVKSNEMFKQTTKQIIKKSKKLNKNNELSSESLTT
jgi:hypothetical protein